MFPSLLPNALQYLLASWLWSKDSLSHGPPTPLRFQLRHQHAVSNSSRIVFSDVHPGSSGFAAEEYGVSTRPVTVHRPASHERFFSSRFNSLISVPWDEAEVEGPNIHDRETLLTLAKMTSNAYTEPENSDWYDLGPGWQNRTYPFGWEPDADGFRGHVFATPDNSTIVISVKGTSAGWLVGGGGPTVKKDKLNDNLLFSCCCARVGPTWSTVCDCYEDSYKCDQGCLEKSLAEDSLFYSIGTNLFYNVTYMYPNSNIWLVGHSLGGSLASLIGVTFGAPAVAFEAPGEKMAARRLHLPSPPSVQHITHIYHTADPIPQGACTGVSSSCAIGGYALESKCHLGRVIRYDTVTQLRWPVDVRTHGIRVIVEKLLASDWDGGDGDDKNGTHKDVPDFYDEEDCVDCYSWEYGDYRNASLASCQLKGL
ncbi:alpha/beta-hydrolase [Daedalea quercina L-15889]|uniref:triacylglycerol lipase n=1 Tax=Daedalea quercina L-15889 TaxID=1314783 RepID=A0A165R6R3_9APHY|nr:alpha/beta-hydrolase [Daedalea quercina L-15889]